MNVAHVAGYGALTVAGFAAVAWLVRDVCRKVDRCVHCGHGRPVHPDPSGGAGGLCDSCDQIETAR